MIEVMKHGDKFKNYFPDGKKIKFTCLHCGCVFKVTAPDEKIKYDVSRFVAPGCFRNFIVKEIAYIIDCPECESRCGHIERKEERMK